MTTPAPPSSFVANLCMPGSAPCPTVPLGSPSEPSAGTSLHVPLNVPETSEGNTRVPSSFAGVGLVTSEDAFERSAGSGWGLCASTPVDAAPGSSEPGLAPPHAALPTAPASRARSASIAPLAGERSARALACRAASPAATRSTACALVRSRMTMSATAMHVDGSNRTRRLSDGDPGGDPLACNTRAMGQ